MIPELSHSGDRTEAAGQSGFVSLRSVYVLVIIEQTQLSRPQGWRRQPSDKQVGQWNSAKAAQAQGAKRRPADPPSCCVLGVQAPVLRCGYSVRARVRPWLRRSDHGGLLWTLDQSPSPVKGSVPKQAPSALCPSPITASTSTPSISTHNLPSRVSQHIPPPCLLLQFECGISPLSLPERLPREEQRDR